MSWRPQPHKGDICLGMQERVRHLDGSKGGFAQSQCGHDRNKPALIKRETTPSCMGREIHRYPFLLACNLLDLDGKTYWCKP